MHASIAVCVMMVGGYVLPESDVTVVPLKVDDLARQAALADQTLGESARRSDLPRVAWVDQVEPSTDVPLQNQKPRTSQRAQQANPRRMPVAPTDPAAGYLNLRAKGMSGLPSGYVENGPPPGRTTYGQQGVRYAQAAPLTGSPGATGYTSGTGYPPNYPMQAAGSGYPSAGYGSAPGYPSSVGYGQPGGYTQSPPVATIGGYTPPNSQGTGYPVSTYNTPTGGITKQFSNYQPPSGYSPWNNLYLSTANGTINTYTAYVKPMVQQQNINMQTNDQINNVQLMQSLYGTPGVQVPAGGGGLIDPSGVQNFNYFSPGSPTQ
jgi:hypothetical protein